MMCLKLQAIKPYISCIYAVIREIEWFNDTEAFNFNC